MKQTIVNLTPHAVNLPGREIPPSGTVARVAEIPAYARDHDGIRLEYTWAGEVIDLPEPRPGVLYVVSATVRLAVPDRNDVASPGKLVRDDEGQVVGCESLILNPPIPGSVVVPYDRALYWALDEVGNLYQVIDEAWIIARPEDITKAREILARRN